LQLHYVAGKGDTPKMEKKKYKTHPLGSWVKAFALLALTVDYLNAF